MRDSTATDKKINGVAIISILFSYSSRFICHLLRSTILLIVLAIFLLFCAIYLPSVFSLLFNSRFTPTRLFDIYFLVSYNMVFFFLIPIIFDKALYRQKLSQVGLQFPKNKILAVLLVLFALSITIPSCIYLDTNKQFHEFYSAALSNQPFYKTLLLQLTALPLFYFSEEFFFRGFLLLNLSKKVGWHSLWITDILFALAHSGKPFLEFIFSIPAGILLAFLTITTRSIVPSIVVHYCIGLTIVFLIA